MPPHTADRICGAPHKAAAHKAAPKAAPYQRQSRLRLCLTRSRVPDQGLEFATQGLGLGVRMRLTPHGLELRPSRGPGCKHWARGVRQPGAGKGGQGAGGGRAMRKSEPQTRAEWRLRKRYISPSAVTRLVTFFRMVTIATPMNWRLRPQRHRGAPAQDESWSQRSGASNRGPQMNQRHLRAACGIARGGAGQEPREVRGRHPERCGAGAQRGAGQALT